MRAFPAILAAAAVLSATAAGQAAPAPRVSIQASVYKVLYGRAVVLSGRLSTGRPGARVAVLSQPYGKPQPRRVRIVTTRADGQWSTSLAPSIATAYSAELGSASSRSITVGVQPRLSLAELGDGKILVRIGPARRFAHQTIKLQLQTSDGGWHTVARGTVRPSSTVLFPPLVAPEVVRASMSVNQAGAGFLGTQSHPLRYSPSSLTMAAATSKVLYGNTVTLSGTLQTGRAGVPVGIDAWPYGDSAPIRVGAVVTGPNGDWRYQARPGIETAYQARVGSLFSSTRVTVGVQPLVTVRELANGSVWTKVSAEQSFAKRLVKLQQRVGDVWQTVAQRPLGPHSTAVFPTPFTSPTTIRVAISVNQAGAGYLGSASHALAYRSRSISLGLSTTRVAYGKTLVLSGRVSGNRAGEPIVIEAQPLGASAPHRIATVTTGPGGRWSFRAAPSIQTVYAARWSGSSSQPATVGVEPALALRELGNGSVWAHVSAGRSLRGRSIQLQRLMPGGGWETVAKRRLDGSSTAVFHTLLPAARIRLALSVNQAGAGYLGAISRVFSYQPT